MDLRASRRAVDDGCCVLLVGGLLMLGAAVAVLTFAGEYGPSLSRLTAALGG